MKYRKTALIEAEQFNGSDEMIKKYDLRYNREASLYEDREIGWVISKIEGDIEVHVNDWIATGVNGEHWAIADDVFKKTYEAVSDSELKGQHLEKALAHMIKPKQHDCPYCNRRRNFPTFFPDQDYAEVRIVMNDTLFIHQYPKPDTAIKINYCPMCGRKLND